MKEMPSSFVPYRMASGYLEKLLQASDMPKPELGIICGSGLSGLSEALDEPTMTVSYQDIPGFPGECGVEGHKGEVVFGLLSGVPTMCFRGRFHSYEGYDMKTVVLPVYVMRCLQVKVFICTNAAGALNPDYKVGDVIAVSDHLALPMLAGRNPLIGPNDNELGPRFPATSDAYAKNLRDAAKQAAEQLGINFLIPHGTYCFVSGPQYESKAECRFLRLLGGDAVGMSTVPEIVAAHHASLQTLCLSLITNQVVMAGDEGAPVATHAEVLEAVEKRSAQMITLVKKIVAQIKMEVLPKLPPLKKLSLIVPLEAADEFHYDQRIKLVRRGSQLGEANTASTERVTSMLIGAALVGIGLLVGMQTSRR